MAASIENQFVGELGCTMRIIPNIFGNLFIASAIGFAGAGGVFAQSNAPRLVLPLDCQPNVDCFIQNYVDVDPSENAKDYACSGATYDGHQGTDFRLFSTYASSVGVNVLASASGTVTAIRDGMPDRLIVDVDDPSITSRWCGNGVMIDNGNGWQTQYCHMQAGSVLAKTGDVVAAGQPIGKVGYSGLAQFAHLHLTVRYNGEVVDPFTGNGVDDRCATTPNFDDGLWKADVREAFIYKSGMILESGFSTAIVKPANLEAGETPPVPNLISASAVIFYARFINLTKGDQISFTIIGPSGEIVANTTKPLERNKAHYVAYSGKNRPDGNWEPGLYKGLARLIRDNVVITQQEKEIELY